MFKRFESSTDVSTSTQVKASVQRGIKSDILASHPMLDPILLDELLPKKNPLVQYKVGPHLTLYCSTSSSSSDDEKSGGDDNENDNVPVFFRSRDGPLLPSLRLVHARSNLSFARVTVDAGAVPYILGGANIMCPGLTNTGSIMPPDVDTDGEIKGREGVRKGDGVVIYAEGKEHALAVGVMKMGSKAIRSKNKGVGVEVAHYLGDGLYQTIEIS